MHFVFLNLTLQKFKKHPYYLCKKKSIEDAGEEGGELDSSFSASDNEKSGELESSSSPGVISVGGLFCPRQQTLPHNCRGLNSPN